MINDQISLLNPSKITVPSGKKMVCIRSNEMPGLYLEVRKTGRMSWFGYTRFRGKSVRHRIGDALEMPYSKARIEFYAWANNIGVNQKRVPLHQLTVTDAFLRYHSSHCMTETARPHEIKQGFERYWKTICGLLLIDLNNAIVKKWQDHVVENFGKETANKQLNLLKACINYQKTDDNYLPRDPFFGVKRKRSNPRNIHLKRDEEYPSFVEVMEKNPSVQADIYQLLLYTGARKSNVLAMKWRDLYLNRQVWIVQAEEAKGKKDLHIVLSPKAIEIISRQPKTGAFVFPSARSKSGHAENVDNFWRDIRTQIGPGDLCLKDLRHTFGTWLAEEDVNGFVIQEAMGHANIVTTKRYMNIQIEPQKKAVNKVQANL